MLSQEIVEIVRAPAHWNVHSFVLCHMFLWICFNVCWGFVICSCSNRLDSFWDQKKRNDHLVCLCLWKSSRLTLTWLTCLKMSVWALCLLCSDMKDSCFLFSVLVLHCWLKRTSCRNLVSENQNELFKDTLLLSTFKDECSRHSDRKHVALQ